MDMLVTPGNGIMFLASFAFLAIGLVGWLSFKRPDLSAKLWMLGFVVSGVAPVLGAFGGTNRRSMALRQQQSCAGNLIRTVRARLEDFI